MNGRKSIVLNITKRDMARDNHQTPPVTAGQFSCLHLFLLIFIQPYLILLIKFNQLLVNTF